MDDKIKQIFSSFSLLIFLFGMSQQCLGYGANLNFLDFGRPDRVLMKDPIRTSIISIAVLVNLIFIVK